MATYYWMSREEAGVLPGTRRTQGSRSLHLLIDNITDLHAHMYDGPTPEPGETVIGVVRAFKPGVSTATHDPDNFVKFKVYVRAEEE